MRTKTKHTVWFMNNYLLRGLILGLTLFFFSGNLNARHIIGGVITYECLGGGDYEFTMKIYRDCNCTNCADFDPIAFIAIYRCGDNTDCSALGQNDYLHRVDAPLLSSENVMAPDYPCLIPPNVCVQEGLYRFKLSDYGINLPALTNDSYHITYQRCCRNETINNIIAPDDSGATYTVELTPDIMATSPCNNSPVFNDFPPIVICAGSPLVFDHSATDPDGDQLVYEFCAPLLGGGPLLSQNLYETCGGANPNPACPPPYDPVSFIVPAYEPLEPMGGDPVVTIDPNTGIITGVPDILGQFVVGVCVKEYRNGVLLSTIFRDFQFNVAPCDPQVVAQIDSDEQIGDQQFVINACGENTVTLANQSFQEIFIDEFRWEFYIDGETVEPPQWNPTVTFPDIGQYEGRLFLNPGTDCGDTANIYINVFPEIAADFEYTYDTCVAGPTMFTDLSFSGSGNITEWNWSFGDGNTSNQQNPNHNYMIPGELPVTLTVTDVNNCSESITQIIEYFPVPALIVIAPSSFIGCAPADIFFDNLSFPIDSTYDINWTFGDGGTSTAISPWYTYEDPGTYTVNVDITSPIGCQTDTTFNELIDILPSPEAGFTYTPEQPSNIVPLVQFTDQSSGAANWFWDFGNGATSFQQSPNYEYPDTGQYQVMQVVTHPSGCTDTMFQLIDVIPEVRYYLPNAFTPNYDSVNDEFRGKGLLEGATNFNFTIWNRWGELIFQTDDPDEGWNGKKHNTGRESPSGVYVVVVSFTGPRGEDYELKGFATLIR